MDILENAFHSRAIAVAGASEDISAFGYLYVRHLLDYGYPGHIYPVNPRKETILGLKAYPDLSSIPEPVDYVICCLPAHKVPDLLAECPARGVKIVHLLTARLSETGRQDARELLRLAAKIPIQTTVQTFSLRQANEALLALKRSEIDGTGVLTKD